MFTDRVGYSAVAQRNEALALELLEEPRRLLRSLFPMFHGREVETAGDAFLVEFNSALEATRCAVEIQRAMAERNRAQPPDRQVQLRIGIHAGDVVHKAQQVMGDAVNIAARIEPLADPGGICISNAVYEQIRNKVEHPVTVIGPAELKNIQVPVVVHRVVLPWQTGAPARRRWPRHRLMSAGVALLAVAIVAAIGSRWGWRRLAPAVAPATRGADPSRPLPVAAGKPLDRRRVAVLPLRSISSDKANQEFADGMTAELVSKLAQISGLRVIDGASFLKGRQEGPDVLEAMGRLEEAHKAWRRAAELDPFSVQIAQEAGFSFSLAEAYDQAIAQGEKAVRMAPNSIYPKLTLSAAYTQKGMHQAAVEMASQARALPGGDIPPVLAQMAHVLAMAGQQAEAEALLTELQRRQAQNQYVDPWLLAIAHVGLSQPELALQRLEQAHAGRSLLLFWTNVEPRFKSLRPHPRFQQLLRKMGLTRL